MKWECFCDAVYYKLWAVKPVDCGDFHQTIHVTTKEEAEFLVESLNSAVPFSVVEEVLKSNTEFLWDKKSADYEIDLLINNIKQKAGL